MSEYGHILPTQTYIANNKPQYISVFDKTTGGDLISPVIIDSSDKSTNTTIAVENDTGNLSVNATGNINLISGADAIVLGGVVVGGASVYVNGNTEVGRVYDDVYHKPPSYATSVAPIYVYNVPGNQRQLTVPFSGNQDQFSLNPGNYMITAYFNNITTLGTVSTLDMYLVQNGTPSAIIPFSQDRINWSTIVTGAGSFVTMKSGVFQILESGLYNFIFATNGNTTPSLPNVWTSDVWSIEIVKFG